MQSNVLIATKSFTQQVRSSSWIFYQWWKEDGVENIATDTKLVHRQFVITPKKNN